ncbi:MAG TPA: class I SAM-dependent methyltransferase [Anaerolineales bacterium]
MKDHREELRAIYDKYALERDSNPIRDWKIAERSGFLTLLQREGKRSLLELGSGTGRDGQFFQANGLEVTCIDLSPAMVELCRQKGLNALVMDMTEIDLPDGAFDAVYSWNSLLHLAKKEIPKVLREMDRLLKPGGLGLIGVFGGYDFEGIYADDQYTPKRFFSFFTDEAVQEKVGSFFDILAFRPVFYSWEGTLPLHFQSLTVRKKPGG